MAATHGRSIFKLDLSPVLEFSAEVAAEDGHLFPIRPARERQRQEDR